MPIRRLPDRSGATVTVLDVDGYYLPLLRKLENQEEELRTVPQWQARDDDIMICAYPKSGTHWLWEILSMLVKKKAERIPIDKGKAMLEIVSQTAHDNIPSPRVLNSHMYYEHLPKDFVRRKCKIIYMLRNPKDVAVSFFNHHSNLMDYDFSGTWEDYVPRFLKGDVDYGTWFDYTLKWETIIADNPDYPILVTTFEDMKEDALCEVTRIAKFLEIECNQNLLRDITELCQFDRMKKDKNSIELVGGWKGGSSAMYRKGEVGDWRNWFTVAQSDHFDCVYQERMKYLKVQPRYTL